jgi:hypothetical protein
VGDTGRTFIQDGGVVVMNIRLEIARLLVPEFFVTYDRLQKHNIELTFQSKQLLGELEQTNTQLTHTLSELKTTQNILQDLQQSQASPIDSYLEDLYQVIPNIAYKDKRIVQFKTKSKTLNGEVVVYLNQLITPKAFEVLKFASTIKTQGYNRMFALADKTAKHTTWVDELNLYTSGDFYLYPEEALTFMRHTCDCEDVSFVIASFDPDRAAVCYGFMTDKVTGQRFGHAYPVYLDTNDQLHIFEATGNGVVATQFDDKYYEPYFIITQSKTYKVKSGVRFGTIAGWD